MFVCQSDILLGTILHVLHIVTISKYVEVEEIGRILSQMQPRHSELLSRVAECPTSHSKSSFIVIPEFRFAWTTTLFWTKRATRRIKCTRFFLGLSLRGFVSRPFLHPLSYLHLCVNHVHIFIRSTLSSCFSSPFRWPLYGETTAWQYVLDAAWLWHSCSRRSFLATEYPTPGRSRFQL